MNPELIYTLLGIVTIVTAPIVAASTAYLRLFVNNAILLLQQTLQKTADEKYVTKEAHKEALAIGEKSLIAAQELAREAVAATNKVLEIRVNNITEQVERIKAELLHRSRGD